MKKENTLLPRNHNINKNIVIKCYFKIISLIFFGFFLSCNYKEGNRSVELNYDMRLTLNSFYVKEFLKLNYFVPDSINVPLNSEIKNYPEQFFILQDTSFNCYYVVETSITSDSIHIQEWGISLSSIYDNSGKKWIYSRDSLNSKMIKNFVSFFETNVLLPTAKIYSQKVSNDNLFIMGRSDAKVLEIH